METVSDPSTFDQFYRENVVWARRLAFLLLPNRETSEDLAHDAFVQLQNRFDRIDNPRAYLRMIVTHDSMRMRRNNSRSLEVAVTASEPTIEPSQYIDLLQLIDALPPRQRAVVILRYFEDLSEAEIADALGCRPGTVKSAAARALASLRREMEDNV